VRKANNLTTCMCRPSWNLGASTSWNPQGLSRPVMGLLYLYLEQGITLKRTALLIWKRAICLKLPASQPCVLSWICRCHSYRLAPCVCVCVCVCVCCVYMCMNKCSFLLELFYLSCQCYSASKISKTMHKYSVLWFLKMWYAYQYWQANTVYW
jgi:hypothetical protein